MLEKINELEKRIELQARQLSRNEESTTDSDLDSGLLEQEDVNTSPQYLTSHTSIGATSIVISWKKCQDIVSEVN